MKKNNKILLLLLLSSLVCQKSQADIVFPAIAHQFMVSLVFPSYYSVLLAVLVLLIEGFFIKKYFGKNWIYGLGLSFLINLISSVFGVFVVTFLEFPTRAMCMGIFGYQNMRLGTYLGMFPGYFLTVLVEWLLLLCWAKLFSKDKFEPKNLLNLSVMMNFFSYLVLFFGVFIADIVTHGQNFKTY